MVVPPLMVLAELQSLKFSCRFRFTSPLLPSSSPARDNGFHGLKTGSVSVCFFSVLDLLKLFGFALDSAALFLVE